MNTWRSICCLGAVTALLLSGASLALATPENYIIVELGILQPSDLGSQGFDVSMTGIGTGRSLGSPTQAFVWNQEDGQVGLPNLASRSYCAGNGANDMGDVVGTGATTAFGSNPLPIIWHDGVVAQLPLPAGQTLGRANDVNNFGVAVGSVGSGTTEYGVMYSGGTATVIMTVTSTGCFLRTAFGINDSGLIVGFGIDPNNAARNVGFVYDSVADVATEVDVPAGDNGAIAFGVSNAGHVVGSSMMNQGDGMPFIWTAADGVSEIPLPTGASQGSARGVNNLGEVVGNAGGVYAVPFFWDGTDTYRIQDLLPAGTTWDMAANTSSSAEGISEDGIIVGTGVHDGNVRGYALIPEGAVATMLQRFAVTGRDDGIEVQWQLALPADALDIGVERAPTASGPWHRIDTELLDAGNVTTVLDTSADPGVTYYYHLNVTTSDGQTFVLGFASAERTSIGALGVVLGAPAPNPTTDATSLAFRLPAQQHVQVTVHDVRGYLVRTLVDADIAGGDHVARWDGRSGAGVRVPAGVYFVNLQTQQASRTQRVVLAR